MERSEKINKIIDLIKAGSEKKLIYCEGVYFEASGAKLLKITEAEAAALIKKGKRRKAAGSSIPDIEIIAFRICYKKWSNETGDWQGPEVSPLPPLLIGKEIKEIEAPDIATVKIVLDFLLKPGSD